MENYHRRPRTSRSKFEDDNDSQPHSQGPTSSIAGSVSGKGGGPAHTAPKSNRTATVSSKPTAQQPYNRPKKHGVMVISPHGKIRTYVSRGLEILTETNQDPTIHPLTTTTTSTTTTTKTTTSSSSSTVPSAKSTIPSSSTNSSTRGVLTIKAQGRSISRAVSIAEILKRRMEGSLHQFTEIGQVSEKEHWDPNPDRPNLDPIVLTRHRPTIRIRLSKELPPVDQALTQGDVTPSVAAAVRQADLLERATEAAIEKEEAGSSSLDRREGGGGEEEEEEESEEDQDDAWPGAVLDRDAAVRRFVGYQAPTGNDIYL